MRVQSSTSKPRNQVNSTSPDHTVTVHQILPSPTAWHKCDAFCEAGWNRCRPTTRVAAVQFWTSASLLWSSYVRTCARRARSGTSIKSHVSTHFRYHPCVSEHQSRFVHLDRQAGLSCLGKGLRMALCTMHQWYVFWGFGFFGVRFSVCFCGFWGGTCILVFYLHLQPYLTVSQPTRTFIGSSHTVLIANFSPADVLCNIHPGKGVSKHFRIWTQSTAMHLSSCSDKFAAWKCSHVPARKVKPTWVCFKCMHNMFGGMAGVKSFCVCPVCLSSVDMIWQIDKCYCHCAACFLIWRAHKKTVVTQNNEGRGRHATLPTGTTCLFQEDTLIICVAWSLDTCVSVPQLLRDAGVMTFDLIFLDQWWDASNQKQWVCMHVQLDIRHCACSIMLSLVQRSVSMPRCVCWVWLRHETRSMFEAPQVYNEAPVADCFNRWACMLLHTRLVIPFDVSVDVWCEFFSSIHYLFLVALLSYSCRAIMHR